MEEEIIYQIALTLIDGIGPIQAKNLIDKFGTATHVFKANIHQVESIEGIGTIKARSIKNFINFSAAEDELSFCIKHNIQPLFIADKNYPKRLLNCFDAPAMLYYKGNADLNNAKVITIIGTRSNTEYGKSVTEKLVEGLTAHNVLVVSGLALGIDAIAHKSALHNELQTVGVLGHGLDTIYPAQNKSLAKEMVQQGGLLTEFKKGITPEAFNFPRRNRIAAGMADVTVAVETQRKGGSMITAELAYQYNRDLFAVPGRLTDHKSSGCNHLIQQNKAIIYTDVEAFIKTMGWELNQHKSHKKQRELFIELTPEEEIIMNIFREKDITHIDELHTRSGLNSSSIAAAVLNMELQNIILSMPGKIYKVL